MFLAALGRLLRRAADWVEAHSGGAHDSVTLTLPGLAIDLRRSTQSSLPSELTVVVPRAELRARRPGPDGKEVTLEIILNSITIADSPRNRGEARVLRPPGPFSRGSG